MNCLCVLLVIAFKCVVSESIELLSSLDCIPITECPVLYDLLKKKPVTSETITFIRTSHCGFEGMVEKVWCPNVKEVTEGPTESIAAFRSGLYPNPTKPDVENNEIVNRYADDKQENDKLKLFPKNCGPIIADKIFGGTETGIDEYPWLALLQYENKKTKKLYNGCGGILINDRYVLTAAHCVTLGNKPVRVVLGEYDTKNETDCVIQSTGEEDCSFPPKKLPIEDIEYYPEWLVPGKRPFYHDIALIRLGETIEFNDFVTPICLPRSDYVVPVNESLNVAGWGRTQNGKSSTIKQQVSLPFVQTENCARLLNKVIGEGQICAGGVAGKDACIGDSGGPLMAFDQDKGAWVAAGVVSLSTKGCGVAEAPGIYTFVPRYLQWIYSTVKP